MTLEKQNLVNFIKGITPMSEGIAHDIVNNFEPLSLNKNDFLLRKGEVSGEYIFLESGFIRAFTIDTNGDEVTTNFYGQRSVVFEVASYIKRIPSQENYQALSECQGWTGSHKSLQGLFHSIPEFREFVRAILVDDFIALKERTLSMITLTAEERYDVLLKSKKEIFKYASLKHIASYLGITDTSLSRIRREITKKSFPAKW